MWRALTPQALLTLVHALHGARWSAKSILSLPVTPRTFWTIAVRAERCPSADLLVKEVRIYQPLNRFSRVCTAHDSTAQRPYSLLYNIIYNVPPLPMGDLDPHLTHGSFDPPGSTTQTVSRSAGLMIVTNRPTDRPCTLLRL